MYTDYLVDINTLFKENLTTAIKHLDKVLLMKYVSRGRNPYDLRKTFDELLLGIEGKGLYRPLLIEKWLRGQYSSKHCHDLVLSAIEAKLTAKPKSTTLKLMKDVSAVTFQVDKLSKIIQVEEAVLRKVKSLQSQGFRVYLFGNMDPVTFKTLQVVYREIFSMVTDCFISGYHGVLKPERLFYQEMIGNFGVNVFKTYLIDDDERDLEHAKSLGIFGGHSGQRFL